MRGTGENKLSKIFITGSNGFIGSHLIPKLVEVGHDVWALERYVTQRYAEPKNVKTVFGDLRDHFAIRNIIHQVQPDIVIHLAAISPVAYSYEHQNEVIETNLMGTVNLAESCLREIPHFKQFITAGSSEEYGIQEKFPINENAELRPNSPYAVSKVAADKYLCYMRDAYRFPVTIMRAFNTYGRRDNMHFVVERIISQMLKDKEVRLGDPEAIRDLLYVDDHVNAYLSCLGNEKSIGETINFCTGRGVSIKELVALISEIMDFKGGVVWNTIPARPLDIKVLIGDGGKAKRLLGWEPRVTLEEGLKRTVDFWREHAK